LLRQVREARADGLLLDLSRNGGGKLESSVDIAGLFIHQGGIVAVKNVFSEVQVLEDRDEDIVYDGPLVILTSRITASASEIVAGAMKDYQRAVIVGDDHTFGKGTVQSFVHQPGRLGAIKVTTALFFRPGGESTQHEGVAADIVLPSLFATEDLGERYTPYSLESQSIPAFITPQTTLTSHSEQNWQPLTDEVLEGLAQRSAERIAGNEEFAEINEQLAKLAERDDVVHLSEWIKEREDAEGEAELDESAEGADSSKGEQADPPADDSQESAEKSGDSEATEPYAEDQGEDDEAPTPQREEALRILADLIELQETASSSWPVPQSASRSESSSSVP
jgi:carboxyl-terminal processing protease